MKILAVEFSSEQRSVALAEKNSDAAARVLGVALETGGRSAHAISLVEQALRDAKLEREEIQMIAIGIGPGSYTGIRAAIALAQGWQLARDVKIMGVSSVACLAAQAWANGTRGAANFIIDAQRGEFYLAKWELNEDGTRELEPLRLVSREEVERRIAVNEEVLGPGVEESVRGAKNFFPDAAELAKLAGEKRVYVSGEKLEPIYLREVSFVKAPPPRIVAG